MAHFPAWRTASGARDLAAILCLGLCLILPRPGLAHPSSGSRIDDLTRKIAAEPGRADLFLQRGELHREARRWNEAEADYADSRRLDPDLAAVDFCLAKLRLDAGRRTDAALLLNRYLKAVPDDGAALALRARIRSELHEYLPAAADYSHAIAAWRVDGTNPPPHLYLGRAAALAAAGDPFVAEALQGVEEGLALLGHPITLELEALALEMRLGRFDQALARVDRQLTEARRTGAWLERRGLVLEKAGRFEEALHDFEGACADFDSLAAARGNVPAITRQLDSIREAIDRVESRLEPAE